MAEMLVGAPLLSAVEGSSAVGLFGAAGEFAPLAGSVATALSSAGTYLSLGLTAASAFGQIRAGQQASALAKLQARQSDLSANQERLSAREQAIQIRKNLDKNLASQNAMFATRGGLAGEGSAAAAAEASIQNANDDINNVMFNSDIKSESSLGQAAQNRMTASSAVTGGYTGALSTIANSRLGKRTLLENA